MKKNQNPTPQQSKLEAKLMKQFSKHVEKCDGDEFCHCIDEWTTALTSILLYLNVRTKNNKVINQTVKKLVKMKTDAQYKAIKKEYKEQTC